MSELSVLTIVANPDVMSLREEHINAVKSSLSDAGAAISEETWLDEGIAFDIKFNTIDHTKAEAIARDILGEAKLDLLAQPLATRRKRLLVTDMDSTIILVECIDEIADYAGLKPKVAEITERAMNGELDFKEALRERVALLEGLPQETLMQVYKHKVHFTPGARELIATMKANGAYCTLISGGFTFFTHRIREDLGFNEDVANELEIVDGKITGRLIEPILDKNSKLNTLLSVSSNLRIPIAETMAVGDGANDLPMLQSSGFGVAYHARPSVRSEAPAKLDYSNLTGLLYCQGYTKEDFVR